MMYQKLILYFVSISGSYLLRELRRMSFAVSELAR
jgi:hypothetical protein